MTTTTAAAPRDLPKALAGLFRPWDEFRAAMDWAQGEHVIICAPTGRGKTTLMLELQEKRSAVVILATKPKDAIFDDMRERGFTKIRKWSERKPLQYRYLLWPKIDKLREDIEDQWREFHDALPAMYSEGHWCIAADEFQYLVQKLGLGSDFEMLLYQGRALKISMLLCFQRPAWVPLAAYSSASHIFLSRTNDDLRNIGAVGSLDLTAIRRLVRQLPRYYFLYINALNDELAVVKVGT